MKVFQKEVTQTNIQEEMIVVTNAKNMDTSSRAALIIKITKITSRTILTKRQRRNSDPNHFKRREVADNTVKQAFASWGDTSNESGNDEDPENTSPTKKS